MHWSLRALATASIATILSVVTTAATAAAAQRTFVASYGLDTNACSLSAPCRGFQAAINAVAAGGEVVVLDSAGYGTMEIHKSVSVIVPTGIHAGLSPSTGIPLAGYPGQYGVVLIDIQNTDVVVLRGLNLNQQGTVTGGIEWISTHGGTVYVENVVVNGFSHEGIYMQAPAGKLLIKDSIFRNNGVGLFVGIGGNTPHRSMFADRVRIEGSSTGVRIMSNVSASLNNSEIVSNGVAISVEGITGDASVYVNRCTIVDNGSPFTLIGTGGGVGGAPHAGFIAAGSTIQTSTPGGGTRTGPSTYVFSWNNNSVDNGISIFDFAYPIQ